jgi:DUF971 family protein
MTQLVPQSLRALRDQGVLELVWSDGRADRLPFFDLRCGCPCATCINEITGEQILRPEQVPRDVAPVELSYSGNYALKIVWSDRHASGIYTWDRLRALGDPRA